MSKEMFRPSRKRDAWGPIRGYVYQVDLTILRWLHLAKTESLILECGEDIDHIQNLLPDAAAETRLLEQVKVRQKGLTLRSAVAGEALASFCEHKVNNPSSNLRFRFLTTSQPGNERPSIANLEGGCSGVLVWEAIRNGDLEDDSTERSTAAIFAYLRNKRRPPSVREDTWNHFLTITRHLTTGRMLEFIKEFEWAVAAPTPSDLADRVQGDLITSHRARSPEEATRKHEHLFVYVFRQLTDKNRKPLTFADIERELAVYEADDEEERLQAQFRQLREHINEQFAVLEKAVDRGFAGMRSRFDELSIKLDSGPSAVTTQQQETTELIRILGNASTALLSWPQETDGHWIDRPQLEELQEVISSEDSSLAVLAGPPGSGKSALLARLGGILRGRGFAFLALKADLLPRDIRSVGELEESLGLGASLTTCLADLAKQRTVVLLIDQLDALGELMDQHSSRLSVLLSLINRFRDLANLHIIVSCREFELRHDTRLARLAGKEVRLDAYPWPDVKQLLEAKGLATDAWPADAQTVLCTAQNLSMFMRHFAEGNSVFETYHARFDVRGTLGQNQIRPRFSRIKRVRTTRCGHCRRRGVVASSFTL